MPTLYLIDGNSYIYRAFYAIRGLSTSNGLPTNAIYGFTNMLLKIIKEKRPDYMVVAFDAPGPTHRHEVFEEYKAHRPGMPDDLKVQVPHIKEIVKAFKIQSIEIEGYEADDILAVLAKDAESRDIDVYIVTGDKDMCQVVSPRIRLYDTMKDKVTGEIDVLERFGVKPAKFPEVIALMGDASDNIPGAPGIGEKTAVKLLKEFGNLENVLSNYDKIRNARARKAVSENIDNIKLSLKLATIHTDLPLKLRIDDMKMKEPSWQDLEESFRRFEFSSLLRLVPKGESQKMDDAEMIKVLDKKTFQDMLTSIKDQLAIDTETTSPFPMLARLVGISIASKHERAYYIPLAHSYPGMPEQLPKDYVLSQLKGILENPNIKKTGHNIKYDTIVLKNEDINIRGIYFDTMIASYLLNPSRSNHNLAEVSMEYLGIKKLSFSDVAGKDKKDFSEVTIDDAARYSGEDAAVTFQLQRILEPEIKKQELDKLLNEIEIPLIEVIADMEMAGIRIDTDLMNSFSREITDEMTSIEKRIYFLAGEEFNINSPKQLQEILFEKLGLKPIKKTKTGYSTNIDVLEQLALTHELPKEIIEFRTLAKLKNTYVDALPKLVNPGTGRLHTSFNQTITSTGRLSSSDPNLQNIPVRGEWGRKIREAFVADEGNLLISSDYSQIELRVLAHLSQDEGLLNSFRSDGDIHTNTACELFGVTPDSVTDDMRRSAKTVNFGIVYGISPYGLSQQLGISPDEARCYIDTYFTRHRGVMEYIQSVIKEAKEKGFVRTIFNRKRAIPELRSSNNNTRLLGERLATNSPIQGTAADIIKISMINIWKRLKKEDLRARMLLQVHDELLFELPEEERHTMIEIVKEEMENAVNLSIPLKVDIGTGKNWAQAH